MSNFEDVWDFFLERIEEALSICRRVVPEIQPTYWRIPTHQHRPVRVIFCTLRLNTPVALGRV